jgi:hypothetical protein
MLIMATIIKVCDGWSRVYLGTMSKARHAFKQQDLTRAIKGAVKAKFPIGVVEIDRNTGNILIHPANKTALETPATETQKGGSEWDTEQ